MKNSAAGADQVTIHQLRESSVQEITEHVNSVITDTEVPAHWKRSILVAIPKGGSSLDPAQTRGLALQSAHRKLFTSALAARIQEFLGIYAPLPPLQNGFRPGHRTADNLFILRTLHEDALEKDKPLLIAQIDIKKAFDSVDRAQLFKKLYSKGIVGPMIDTLKRAFTGQEISIRANKQYSDLIANDIGVPQGDPLSPLLFILYVADLQIQSPTDPQLDGHPIPYIALADDFTIVDSRPEGLQQKLNELSQQCAPLNLKIHPQKCTIFTMGSWTNIRFLRPITIDGIAIPRERAVIINGYKLQATELINGWDSDTQALIQNRRASQTFRTLNTIKTSVGVTTPKHLRQLYRSLVESQYSYGLESRFDTTTQVSATLDQTQRNHLRSIVGLHPKSITNVLFRDLQILPMSLRTLHLTTKYTAYLTNLPNDRPVKWAYNTQRSLNSGWYSRFRAQLLPFGMDLNDWHNNPDMPKTIEAALWKLTNSHLLTAINNWPRLAIWKRFADRPLIDNPQPQSPAKYLEFPFYLARACARLRTSSHNFAIQRYRMNTRHKPRQMRYCPHCIPLRRVVETEYHALIECPKHEVHRSQIFKELPNPIYTILHQPTKEMAEMLYQILNTADRTYNN